MKATEHSLRRLGVREMGLYQVHWPDPWEQVPLKRTMRAMERLYKEGKIRAGLAISPSGILRRKADACLKQACSKPGQV